jgi:hypothetical protein
VHDESRNGRPRKSGERMELVEEMVIWPNFEIILSVQFRKYLKCWKVRSWKQFIALSSVETMMVAMWRQINSTNSLWHLLSNKYIFHTLNRVFLILITFQDR